MPARPALCCLRRCRRVNDEDLSVAERQDAVRWRGDTAAVALCDPQGRLLYTSPGLLRLFGDGQAGPLDLFALVHPDEKPALQQLLEGLTRPGADDATVDLRIQRAD